MAWAPDYLTASELKADERISDTDDDAQIARAITASSRAVDKCAGRQFGKVAAAEERFYLLEYSRRTRTWRASIDDLQDLADFAVGDLADLEYHFEPRNAVLKGLAFTHLVVTAGAPGSWCSGDDLGVTAWWGWTAVPVSVKQATALQASRLLARRDSPFGVAGSPSIGSELRLLDRVDPDVKVTLGHYVRDWWAA